MPVRLALHELIEVSHRAEVHHQAEVLFLEECIIDPHYIRVVEASGADLNLMDNCLD